MRAIITEEQYQVAVALHDDYWRRAKKDENTSSAGYSEACRSICAFEAQRNVKTSHQLAQFLLANPDIPVVGESVGQGSNEQGDAQLWDFEVKEYGRSRILVLALSFGDGPITGQ